MNSELFVNRGGVPIRGALGLATGKPVDDAALMTLAEGFVQHHAGSHRDVEAFDLTDHGDLD